MRIIACIICFTILTFPSHAQGYYEEGTRWTELKLDTLRYESWFTEVNDGGTTKYIPNYERTDFYIKGDTTKLNSTRMKGLTRQTRGRDSTNQKKSYTFAP